MPTSQPLPPKEKNLFNRILKCYEQKQYRNGLKFAKQILSNPKFSEHGETLAMKGLTLNCTGKKEEAYELVKRGLKNDLKSHVCWHVYGLLQRSDKKYDEAIKCYRNALRWDKDNLHILRDLSMLQVHMRDLEGYRETRYKLLQLKPGQRASWIGYAISNHLLKDYTVAFKVLEEFGKTQQSQDAPYELGELLLYQNNVLREAENYQEALNHLEENKSKIVDKQFWLETKADLLLSLGKETEAEKIITDLLYRNPENHRYYQQLEAVLKPENEEERLQVYESVARVFPKADSPQLLPLTFTTGEKFKQLVDKLMRHQLKRGVPPLYTSLKPLYKDPAKVKVIEGLMEGYIENLEKSSKFAESDTTDEPPTTLLWARFYMAQHFDALKQHEKALNIIEQSLEHTPTLIELHAMKAKILKHLGDTAGAMASMDEAQSLDTADRFINCKCASYMIRNGMISEAEETASKFTRENVSVEEYLREMQCMWYEIECATSYAKSGQYGNALKKCHEVDRHFTEIIEDQFDFHQYCMRKMTLRAYVKMLKLEDSLRSHSFYFQAARIAIQVYLHLHDEPYKAGGGVTNDQDATMSSAELKKLRNKQRRQERKKAAAEEKRKQEQEKSGKRSRQQQQKNQKNEDEADAKKDVEFDPEKLASVADPLEQATKFLVPLQLHCSKRFDTHLFAFQIAERRGKLLVMLRSLLRCDELADAGDRAELHVCKVRFAKKVRDANGVASAVSDVISQFMPKLFGDVEIENFNLKFLEESKKSLLHLFAGCRSMHHLDNGRKEQATDMLLRYDDGPDNIPTLQTCEAILDSLKQKEFGELAEATMLQIREKFRAWHPRACVFAAAPEPVEEEPVLNGIDEHSNETQESGDSAVKTSKPHRKSEVSDQKNNNNNHSAETSALIENHCSHGD
uniref:N-alpha-acetyltransferase 16, NatA auxiliary subunit-like n=1 Tax=Phallusia mammillata TaxID=59560 RepID=A0A6F9DMH6_9ASCI|nr:N-alpha-acetyltransferase 16, NatA auxiliary subunit-like [Phallusia mammillata]